MKMCSFTRSYTRKDYNNFKDMKTKRRFVSPHVKVAETDLEGLICTSGFEKTQVDRLHNINAEPETSSYYEPLNVEF